MNRFRIILAVIALGASMTLIHAQTNAPVRLAVLVEDASAQDAGDLLTAALSKRQDLQLFDRTELDKAYREQALSAGNKDYLKLGQVLGADGLLLFNILKTPFTTNLTARLIAVKPGVILTEGSFPWPLKDAGQWTESVSAYLNSFLPKLTVQAGEAIPISIVNLRSAVQSADAMETEKDLKLLAIQRLSQERQFFVLERQQMQLLSEEKELKAEESAFWNGAYLLEGVIDQNGYSKERLTINARLTPRKGGAPLRFEVSGNRTNLADVVDHLAASVTEALKLKTSAPAWKAADEAAQYFQEARWALRWGAYSEAEAAANSAWALGKHDLECAMIRVQSYTQDALARAGQFDFLGCSFDSYRPFHPGGPTIVIPPDENHIRAGIKENLARHPWGARWKETHDDAYKSAEVHYIFATGPLDVQSLVCAEQALELYEQFSRTSPEGEPKVLEGHHNSGWYNAGLDSLSAAAKVLQHFYVAAAESRKPLSEKAASLRSQARLVAALISHSPSVHDSYWVGDRVATYEELDYTIGGSNPDSNIFRCEVECGCFWQETPEDCVALYRELAGSPVFCYIHRYLWFRDAWVPRLIAWNDEDELRIPVVWSNFVNGLDASTNVLWRLEAKAIRLADAPTLGELSSCFTNFFNALLANREALINNNVDVLYLEWDTGTLLQKMGGDMVSDLREELKLYCGSEYRPKLESMHEEYSRRVAMGAVFQKQKLYLKSNKPYDFFEFGQLFNLGDYSRSEALELQPLVAAYKSNLVAQSEAASGIQKAESMGGIGRVEMLEDNIHRILNPPIPAPPASTPIPPPQVISTIPVATNAPETVSNILAVNQFMPIPLDGLPGDVISDVKITAHQWFDGELLLDFDYMGARSAFSAIAILNPETKHWRVVAGQPLEISSQNFFYNRSVLAHGDVYNCDGGKIWKYNFIQKQWEALKISDGNHYELFAIKGHLYAANGDVIFEIMDDGKGTRILASTRRRPPVSALDTKDWGLPTLFGSSDHSLRVIAGGKIDTWTGNDWREDAAEPPSSFLPEIIPDGILFREDINHWPKHIATLTYWGTETNSLKLCLRQEITDSEPGQPVRQITTTRSPDSSWDAPSDPVLSRLPAAATPSSFFLLINHSQIEKIAGPKYLQEKVVSKDGYHATLLCYSKDLSQPQKLYLNFAAQDGCPPSVGINTEPDDVSPDPSPAWIMRTTHFLLAGLETSRGAMSMFNDSVQACIDYKAGVWLLPLSQLEREIAAQQQCQRDQMAQSAASADGLHKNLLAKYDHNDNGIIDPEEKEEALSDPGFIESELELIDTNHNGVLDPEELSYFDANKNGVLDTNEEAGIRAAEKLLAPRTIKNLNQNGDGGLDENEFLGAFQNSHDMRFTRMFFNSHKNAEGKLDADGVALFLLEKLKAALWLKDRQARSDFVPGVMMDPLVLMGKKNLKDLAERYWQSHRGDISKQR